MKRWIWMILCVVLAGNLAGCGSGGSAKDNENQDIAYAEENAETDYIFTEEDSASDDNEYEEEIGEIVPTENGTDGVDVDLTQMSATMVYSEVYNMVADPRAYMDKVIKIKGICNVYTDPDTDKVYHACLISDATACCAQGIEYHLDEGDYPEGGAEITVIGTFGTYWENTYEYCRLNGAEIVGE